jgi:hypothetical protein
MTFSDLPLLSAGEGSCREGVLVQAHHGGDEILQGTNPYTHVCALSFSSFLPVCHVLKARLFYSVVPGPILSR